MKATGIIRRIDDLGRVVIPKEIRRSTGLREGDPLEFSVSKDGDIVLSPYRISLAHQVRAMKDLVSNQLCTGNSVREDEALSYLERAAKLIDKLENPVED